MAMFLIALSIIFMQSSYGKSTDKRSGYGLPSWDKDDFVNVDAPLHIQGDAADFSLDLQDYAITINSSSVPLVHYEIKEYDFFMPWVLLEGRNHFEFSGKDSQNQDIIIDEVFWAGSAIVEVFTEDPSTVDLKIELSQGGNDYDFTLTKDTVDNRVLFKSVPQLPATITVTSSSRQKKSQTIQIKSHQRIFFN
jgi:hypothetical protein